MAVSLLGEALRAGWELSTITLSTVVVGGMALNVLVPFWLMTLALGVWLISEGQKAIRHGRRLTAEGVQTQGVVIDR
jgi:hypothetical protein